MTTPATLSEEHQQQFDFIQTEVQRFIEDEAYHQGIERLDAIIASIGETEDYRLLHGAFLSRRAELYLELDDDESSWADAQKAMNFGWYDAVVHSIAGWAMYNMESLDVARDQFEHALALEPDRVSSLMGRAMVLLDLEDWDEARIDLTRVTQLDSQYAHAYALRAEIGIALKTLDAAARDIQKARDIEPEDADYALTHARLLTASGDAAMAIKALKVAVSDEAPALEAILLRSHLYLLGGEDENAKDDATRASNMFPEEAFAFVQLANVQLSRGNSALAMKAAERAVKLDPSLPDAFLVRATAKQLADDAEGAKSDYEAASKGAPELPVFMLGAIYDAIDATGFNQELLQVIQPKQQESASAPPPGANPFEGLGGGIPGLGGMDPAKMLDQVFDSEGNIRPSLKPIMRMAMKNAPSLLKTVPPSMLKNMGGIDPDMLNEVDMDNLSEEQLEEQMKLFYKMVKGGKDPMDIVREVREQDGKDD